MTEPVQSADTVRHEPSPGDWAEAVRRVRAYYPEDIFPWPSESLEGKAAMMARQTCDNVRTEAYRLMEERLWVPLRADQSDGTVGGEQRPHP